MCCGLGVEEANAAQAAQYIALAFEGRATIFTSYGCVVFLVYWRSGKCPMTYTARTSAPTYPLFQCKIRKTHSSIAEHGRPSACTRVCAVSRAKRDVTYISQKCNCALSFLLKRILSTLHFRSGAAVRSPPCARANKWISLSGYKPTRAFQLNSIANTK